jgi:hypothetical protein
MKKRRSFSRKKKINSYKFLSVMDHSGQFIYARLCLGANDREVYTSSPRMEITSQRMSLLQLTAVLKVMEVSDVRTKIQDRMKSNTVQSHMARGKDGC